MGILHSIKSLSIYSMAVAGILTGGCGPVLLGTGAAGGYKVATDERSVGGVWDDVTITTKVKAALAEDPTVRARKIDVDTIEGVVTLTGVVDTTIEAERAVEVAREISGVKKVKDNLQIGSKSFGQILDDKLIGSKIKAKLVGEPGIRSLNVDVDVNNGIATLTGIVEYTRQRDCIIEIARNTGGVVKVIDNITVRYP